MKQKIIFLVFFITCSYSLFSQNSFNGLVTDSKEVPIENALITIINEQNNRTIFSTITDSLGRYRLSIPPANSLLTVSILGYEYYSIPFPDEKINEIIISRLKEKDVTLQEVVVEASSVSRMKRDGNKFIIDKIENSIYAKGNNAYTFLRYVPVLDVPVFEGAIRVKNGGDATLQINGRRTHLSMESLLKSIRAEDIERIEIIAHPGAEYSGNISIINVVMKKRPDEGTKFYLSASDYNTGINRQNGSFSMSHSSGKIYFTSGIFVNNNRRNSESENSYRYYLSDFLTTMESISNVRILDISAYANMDYELNKKNTLGMRISGGGRDIKNNSYSHSDYRKLSTNTIDSSYISTDKASSPSFFSSLNANFNYTLKTDDKGSILYVDLDYVMSRPKTENHTIFEKAIPEGTFRENDFIQKNNTTVDVFGLWGRYNHIFDQSTKLNSGISLSKALGKYNHFYGDYIDGNYISNPDRTNNLDYDDLTFSLYTSFQKNWSEKFMSILGIRIESYHANGFQKEINEKISRNETDFLPSIFLYYVFSDNHDLSLNASKSVARPRYSDLNPFKTFTSPSTYIKGNPELKVINMYKGGISYSFFDDYSFSIQSLYADNNHTWFTIPDENGRIMTTQISYGSMLGVVPSLSASKSLFKGFLYLSADIDYSYRSFEGKAQNVDIDIHSWTSGFSVSTDIFLDKKKSISSYISYSYEDASKSAASYSPVNHDLQFSLRKVFTNSTLMLGFITDFRKKNKLYYETSEYGYTNLRKNYWNLYLTYSISFGNNKVKNVHNRSNEQIQSRFD